MPNVVVIYTADPDMGLVKAKFLVDSKEDAKKMVEHYNKNHEDSDSEAVLVSE